MQKRIGERLADDEQESTDPEGDPEGLSRETGRALVLAGTGSACNDRSRAVREEVEDRERTREHRPRKSKRCELRPAKVSDDRRVDEHVERLCRQCAECGKRQAKDLAVV
jgi:hypothetical protein